MDQVIATLKTKLGADAPAFETDLITFANSIQAEFPGLRTYSEEHVACFLKPYDVAMTVCFIPATSQ
jgi:hypothetical protein